MVMADTSLAHHDPFRGRVYNGPGLRGPPPALCREHVWVLTPFPSESFACGHVAKGFDLKWPLRRRDLKGDDQCYGVQRSSSSNIQHMSLERGKTSTISAEPNAISARMRSGFPRARNHVLVENFGIAIAKFDGLLKICYCTVVIIPTFVSDTATRVCARKGRVQFDCLIEIENCQFIVFSAQGVAAALNVWPYLPRAELNCLVVFCSSEGCALSETQPLQHPAQQLFQRLSALTPHRMRL